jgi:hypothetical protein
MNCTGHLNDISLFLMVGANLNEINTDVWWYCKE